METGKDTYFKLELFKGKQTWPQLVYNDLRQEIPGELLAFITSVGVTNQSDRIGVAQIIISIESWFNKFDRVLKEAQEQITEELRATFVTGATSNGHDTKKRRKDEKDESEGNNVFGPPSLRLVSPTEINKKTKALAAVKTIRTAAGAVSHSAPASIAYANPRAMVASDKATDYKAPKSVTPLLVVRTIGWFKKVESALEGVERATTRGLTNAKIRDRSGRRWWIRWGGRGGTSKGRPWGRIPRRWSKVGANRRPGTMPAWSRLPVCIVWLPRRCRSWSSTFPTSRAPPRCIDRRGHGRWSRLRESL